MYCKRDIEEQIIRVINSPEHLILLLSGARQTGKSTLIENIPYKKPHLILNFWDETPDILALKEAKTLANFENYLWQFYNFKPTGEKILIIDEAQASKTLGKFLMQIHRSWPNQKLVLLGSILTNLYTLDMPIPTGRVIELICRPLNFREYLRFRKKENYLELLCFDFDKENIIDQNIHLLLLKEYEIFLQIGGLPGIVNAYNTKQDFTLLMETFLNNVYKDADRFMAKSVNMERTRAIQYGSLVEHILKMTGSLVCSPSTNSSILSTDSPSYRHILPAALEALKSWHLIYILSFEMKELTSKKGYSSKKYLFDTGVLNYFINRFFPVALEESSLGAAAKLLENMVIQELVTKTYSLRNITSYKSQNKSPSEVDYLVTMAGKIWPVEVKLGNKITNKSISQVIECLHTKNLKEGYVVYTGLPQKRNIQGKDIYFLPPYYLSMIEHLGLKEVATPT